MPITKYITGDLLSHPGPIAHGVNCQGKMNSGVARAIRNKYPKVFTAYLDFISDLRELDNKFKPLRFSPLGFTNPVYVFRDEVPEKMVLNLFTQDRYGNDGKQYVDYEAVRKCFANIHNGKGLFRSHEVLGIPKIGAGLGGGDWNIIEQIINDATPDLEIWVYELER